METKRWTISAQLGELVPSIEGVGVESGVELGVREWKWKWVSVSEKDREFKGNNIEGLGGWEDALQKKW